MHRAISLFTRCVQLQPPAEAVSSANAVFFCTTLQRLNAVQELSSALDEEIKAEQGLVQGKLGGDSAPSVPGFNITTNGAEVSLTKTHGNENYVIVVEQHLAVLDYLSDSICLLYWMPGAYGVVTLPNGVREGINQFLDGFIPSENMRFRNAPTGPSRSSICPAIWRGRPRFGTVPTRSSCIGCPLRALTPCLAWSAPTESIRFQSNAAAWRGKKNSNNKKKNSDGREDSTVLARDSFKIFVSAGSGGNGLHRYNGIGGSGGFVYARPIEKLSFDAFCDTYSSNEGAVVELMAEDGQHAKQTKLSGQHGKDRIFNVPLGVEIVGENNGGMGGCANNNFIAEKGEAFWITVNLKLTPNVGLIGFPNAGKSTLMQALVPNKHIKIAPYPFTTTLPQLCYIKYGGKLRSPTAVDDDDDDTGGGVVTTEEKAVEKQRGEKNVGYDAFNCLKHLEYSDIIVMIVDVHGFQLGPNEPYRSALEMIALLNKEMEQYDRALVKKPVVLLLNKVDVEDGEQKAEELCEFLLGEGRDGRWPKRLTVPTGKESGLDLRPYYPIRFRSIHAISAKARQLGNVKTVLRKIYRELKPLKKALFVEEWEDWSNHPRGKILC
uniref:GTP-binding protein n=1 Tax=Globodera rostochiensis TaxID=31243 RepID=A0A914I3F7_GLORO